MSRLSEIFKASGKCFLPFVTAGHPSLDSTEEIVLALAQAGAHIIEIGLPFSDPIADGPVIQRSSFSALRHGHSLDDYLAMVSRVRARSDVGLIFMSYLNPLLSYGLERLEKGALEAGLDGLLVSDLTPEEQERLGAFPRLDTIFLAAPTSSDQRLEKIVRASRGFLYLVARTGVTGNQTDVEQSVPRTIRRIRRLTDLPVAVGFGISTAADVKRVWQLADGAVVGTAIVRFIEGHRDDPNLPERVARYVREQLLPVQPGFHEEKSG